MLKIYGLKKCSTCQKANAWLEAQNIPYEFIDLKEHPPTLHLIETWSKALGGYEKIINRAGYTWRGLKPSETENLDNVKAAALIQAYPSLIRRPLICYPQGEVTTGFSEKIRKLIKPSAQP